MQNDFLKGEIMQAWYRLIIFLMMNIHYATALPTTISTMSLKVGEMQRIELPSNPTTGYSWYPTRKIEKNPIISLVKSGYEADDTPVRHSSKGATAGGLAGSGGTQYWEIKGKKVGNYTLTLQYKRPWEKKTKPAEIQKFMIIVH